MTYIVLKNLVTFYKPSTKNKRSGKNRVAQITQRLYGFVCRELIKARTVLIIAQLKRSVKL